MVITDDFGNAWFLQTHTRLSILKSEPCITRLG